MVNTPDGIVKLVQQILEPELIVVEGTGGATGMVEALFVAGMAVVNHARVRQFARACKLLANTDQLEEMLKDEQNRSKRGAS